MPTPVCQLPALSEAICCGIWRMAARIRPEGQFGGGIGRRARVLARGHDDAARGAGVDVDVRVDAALADQLELGQPLEQRRADLGALADQDQDFGVLKALGERVDVLDMVVPDRDLVAVQLLEARQRANGVVIVVENGDFHSGLPPASIAQIRCPRRSLALVHRGWKRNFGCVCASAVARKAAGPSEWRPHGDSNPGLHRERVMS